MADEPRSDSAETSAPPAELPPRLRRAEGAFAAGDYRLLRAELDALRTDGDPRLRARADQLARAIGVDPVLVGVLIACLLALLAVFFHYEAG